MRILSSATHALFAGYLCAAPLLCAQAVAPVAPTNLTPIMATDAQNTIVTPDDHALSGGQVLSVGSWGKPHSFIRPSFRAFEMLDSDPTLQSNPDGSYRGLADVGGDLEWVQYLGKAASFRYFGALRYDAQARLLNYSQYTNTHDFSLSDSIHLGHSKLLFADQAGYSQGSSFGAAGMEGMGLSDDSAATISAISPDSFQMRSDVLPNNSILIGRVGAVTNTALVEWDTHQGPRNTVTAVASYGLLHFDSSQLTDSEQVSAIAGYDHRLNAKDSIAFEGAFARFNFQLPSTFINVEYFSAVYARQVAGRVSFLIAAGPAVSQSRTLGANYSQLDWQGRGTLRYSTNRIGLSATAVRTITAGAGVLNGSIASTGQGGLDLILSRSYTSSFMGGVSRNQELESAPAYDTQFAGAVLTRRLGQYSSLYLNYNFEHQAGPTFCVSVSCNIANTALVRHVFGIGYSWTPRASGVE